MADASAPAQSAPAAQSNPAPSEAISSASESADSSAETVAAIDANPDLTKQEKIQAKKMLKSLKFKVDGQEFSENLPFDIEDTPANRKYMEEQLQMSKVARKRMGEKANLEKEVTSFLSLLKSNPEKALSQAGVDVKNMAAKILQREIDNAAKSPEQLRAEQLEQQLQELKEERDREKKESEAAELKRLTEQSYTAYENDVISELTKANLPQTPFVVDKIAAYLKLGVSQGLDIKVADVMPIVREEMMSDIRKMAQTLPIETLEEMFGSDVLGKIRKKNIAKAKAAPSVTSKTADVGAQKIEKVEEPAKKVKFKDFFGI